MKGARRGAVARACAGMAPCCRCSISKCVVQSRVSSQSNMVTVCAVFGRDSCGMKARERSSFSMYLMRMSSCERACEPLGCAALFPCDVPSLLGGGGGAARDAAACSCDDAPSATPTLCRNLSRHSAIDGVGKAASIFRSLVMPARERERSR